MTDPTDMRAALAELVAADNALQAWCEAKRLAPKPLIDPMGSCSALGITITPDPEHDAIIARLRAAWVAARRALSAHGSEPADDSGPLLDDDGRAMVGASHHYTAENIRAIIADLKAVEQGGEFPALADRDHRTRAGVLWRVMSGLACDVPLATAASAAPVQPTGESNANRPADEVQEAPDTRVPRVQGDGQEEAYRETAWSRERASHAALVRGEALTGAAAPVQQGAQPVALWQFRWTNPAGYEHQPEELLAWEPIKPRNYQTLEQHIAELEAYRHCGKPCYEVRALYAAPPAPVAPEPPEGWVLVPRTLTPQMRDALLSCEAGEFSVQGGWDYILAAAPTTPEAL